MKKVLYGVLAFAVLYRVVHSYNAWCRFEGIIGILSYCIAGVITDPAIWLLVIAVFLLRRRERKSPVKESIHIWTKRRSGEEMKNALKKIAKITAAIAVGCFISAVLMGALKHWVMKDTEQVSPEKLAKEQQLFDSISKAPLQLGFDAEMDAMNADLKNLNDSFHEHPITWEGAEETVHDLDKHIDGYQRIRERDRAIHAKYNRELTPEYAAVQDAYLQHLLALHDFYAYMFVTNYGRWNENPAEYRRVEKEVADAKIAFKQATAALHAKGAK